MRCPLDLVVPDRMTCGAGIGTWVDGMKADGIRSGTKAKRPQSVILRGLKKVALVRWLRPTCVATDPLTGWKQAQTVHFMPQLRRCLVTW